MALERGDAVAGQPAFQQPSDPVAGVAGVEILRRDTERLELFTHLALLGPVRLALGEDGDRLEFAGLLVQRLLGHAHGNHTLFVQGRFGLLQRPSTAFSRQLQRPGRGGFFTHEDFEVNLFAVHAASPLRTLSIAH
jgi:hypothetical protein